MDTFDVAVLGLGAIGSAAVYQIAKCKARVLGIDRYSPPHRFGSSHGSTRITREAIGEGEHLTPLARRSHHIWREIESETGRPLLSTSGVLIISSPARTSFTHVESFLPNTIAAADKYGIPYELLDAGTLRTRYPQFNVRDDELGYFEPGGGFVRPEACVAAQLDMARRHGADIRVGERVRTVTPSARGVRIRTDSDEYYAGTVVLAAGAWLPEFLDPGVARVFRVFRQVMFWFAPDDGRFRLDRFPVFIWELRGPSQAIYGFPDLDCEGVKIATEQYDAATTAESIAREVSSDEADAIHRNLIAPFLPQLPAIPARSSVCLYTVTPDFGFVIDRHPQNEHVIIASCCSGHGFKHSAALGEVLAELALTGHSRIDLAPFALERLLPV